METSAGRDGFSYPVCAMRQGRYGAAETGGEKFPGFSLKFNLYLPMLYDRIMNCSMLSFLALSKGEGR